MKNLKIVIIVVLIALSIYFLFSLFLHHKGSAVKPLSNEVFADQVMLEWKNNKPLGVQKYFYIPKIYTAKNIQEDQKVISSLLSEIRNTLGDIDNFSKDETREEFYQLWFGPDISKEIPYKNVEFKVVFKNFGHVKVFVGVHEENSSRSVAVIDIGFPNSNPKSLDTVKKLNEFMNNAGFIKN